MKILFILLDKQSHCNFFPLGVAYLAASCRERGYEDITIWNQEVYHYPDESIKSFIEENSFDVVCMGVIGYQQFKKGLSVSKYINQAKNRPTFILGQHGPSASPELFLEKYAADIACIGEAEITFCNLLDTLSNNKPLKDLKGIAFRNGEDIQVNEKEALIENLDSVPFPAWDLFPVEHYALEKHIAASHTDRCFPVLASRGCVYTCNFCYRLDTGYRLRSLENIFEEIRQLKERYNITHITFADENLMYTPKYAIKFAEGWIDARLDMTWNCMGRLRAAKPDVLEIMKKAGCRYINYGIESLDQNVLDQMNKKQTVEEAYWGVENTINAGLLPGLNIIWGALGDNEKSLELAVDFLIKYNSDVQIRTIKPVTPYPGTPLFNLAVKNGYINGPEEFYSRHLNTDKFTVNFTDLPTEECYRLLFDANKKILTAYYDKLANLSIKAFEKCYFEDDNNFRGPRHR